MLATALAVYVANATLDNTDVGAQYGFLVQSDGVGTALVKFDSNGTAFGVANNAQASGLDLLLAANSRSKNGFLYDLNEDGSVTDPLESGFRTMASNLFAALNQIGGI